MPKYCPTCESEFSDDVSICPRDKEKLTSSKPSSLNDYFVDIYAAADEIEAERIISYLESIGIAARESVSGLSQIPVASDTSFIICVQKSKLGDARDAIKQARSDLVISEDGSFI